MCLEEEVYLEQPQGGEDGDLVELSKRVRLT